MRKLLDTMAAAAALVAFSISANAADVGGGAPPKKKPRQAGPGGCA
jgi:hypothetical protein